MYGGRAGSTKPTEWLPAVKVSAWTESWMPSKRARLIPASEVKLIPAIGIDRTSR